MYFRILIHDGPLLSTLLTLTRGSDAHRDSPFHKSIRCPRRLRSFESLHKSGIKAWIKVPLLLIAHELQSNNVEQVTDSL